ncbi:riboflavin synthase alpha chain [Hydrogenivirga caldilitoris]|uniref:Riboflavin synthase n=1 Tax=Hydrogenivirga caldilitoris TaxID=246264 RepID=A0A497XP45_9AQUI|nr:riboflavin synthase [Hydrogenivirga caldilitoris]RLJ70074.1 riboflavin synthase alpha chain [Hydrogenivirga caldilitoris]
MFTGLVEELGEVFSISKGQRGGALEVKSSFTDVRLGDSVAVNGACLTVVKLGKGTLTFELSPETLDRTNLKFLKKGDLVNLERALRADSRLGGHFVLGHVDFTARVLSFKNLGRHRELLVEVPPQQRKFFVEKGSVAIDGISLTVNYVGDSSISINVIPHTYENTNLKTRKPGDIVNVEVDILGKYVLNYLDLNRGNIGQKLEKLF